MRVPGPLLFARYAYPPNALGYCGPDDAQALIGHTTAGESGPDLAALARQFAGAWPYLQLIAASAGRADPLDGAVVEAYWLGNRLLRTVDPAVFAAHLVDRFEARGRAWPDRPDHAGPVRRRGPPQLPRVRRLSVGRACSAPARPANRCGSSTRAASGGDGSARSRRASSRCPPSPCCGTGLSCTSARPGRNTCSRDRSGSPGADRAARRHGEHALGLGLRCAHPGAGRPPAGGHRAHPPHDQRGARPPGRRGRPGLSAQPPSRVVSFIATDWRPSPLVSCVAGAETTTRKGGRHGN